VAELQVGVFYFLRGVLMSDRRSINHSMFWRVLRRSAFANRGRLLVILLALGTGAAITAALLNLQVDAKRRITSEFRAFGANVLLTPRLSEASSNASNTMKESTQAELQSVHENPNYVAIPFLYLVAKVSPDNASTATDAVIAGTHLDLLENREPGWRLQPEHPSDYSQDECLAGVKLATQLRLRAGSSLQLKSAQKIESCRLVAVLSSGGPEDDQAFVPLAVAQRLADASDRVSVVKVFVSGTPQKINEAISALQRKFPDVDVRPIRQFTEGEARLYNRISGILTATVAVVLILTALCVMAAMTNVAMERRNDVGLMKAIGGSVRRVLRLFLAEAALLGLAGGMIGAAIGIVISMGLGKAVFGVAAQPRLIVYPISVALTVIVAILAAYPLRRLVHIRPASVFRGEE
jgi:putative ABC transport system permease protein